MLEPASVVDESGTPVTNEVDLHGWEAPLSGEVQVSRPCCRPSNMDAWYNSIRDNKQDRTDNARELRRTPVSYPFNPVGCPA